MPSFPALPEKINNAIKNKLLSKEDIRAFLAPPESVSRSERPNVWIILTNYSIIFCIYEDNSEPIIDTLDLKNLQELEYIERKQNIHLDFIPFKKAGNSFKITYSLKRQDDINNFCEKIADYITYKKEKTYGIETFYQSLFKNSKNNEIEPSNEKKPDIKTQSKESIEERQNKVAQQNLLLKEILSNSLKRSQNTQVSVLKPLKKLNDSDYTSLPHTVSSIGKDRSNLLPAAISGDKVEVKTVAATQINETDKNIKESKKEENIQKFHDSSIPTLRKTLKKSKDKATLQETETNQAHPVPVMYYSPTSSKPGAIPKYNEEEPEILPELLKKPDENISNEKTNVYPSKINLNNDIKTENKQQTSSIINETKSDLTTKSVLPQSNKTEKIDTITTTDNKTTVNKTENFDKNSNIVKPVDQKIEDKIEDNIQDNIQDTIKPKLESTPKEAEPVNNNNKIIKQNENEIPNGEPKEIVLMESGNAPVSVLITASVAAASAYVWYKLFKFVQKNF